MPEVSLIISVFNKFKELELLLDALTVQSFDNFEVIIADDGSGEFMRKFCTNAGRTFNLDVKFVTQEKNGFRKNRILNKAISVATTDYLIFTDGDCIPHPDFIYAHYSYKRPNTVLSGRRVFLSSIMSEKISRNRILYDRYSKIGFGHLRDYLRRGEDTTKFLEEGIIIRNGLIRSILRKKNVSLIGCNFSLDKKLMEKINGFDENYEGPGIGEDTDIEYRLRLAGAEFFSVRNLAVQYHIYHKKTAENSANLEYFEKIKKEGKYFCKNGLIKN